MTETTKKTAIVTGATGGIGNAVTLRLSEDGFAIAAAYAGNAAKGEELAATIKSAGRAAISIKADVNSASDVERLFKNTLESFGRIDVVVHTAGIMPMSKIADGDLD